MDDAHHEVTQLLDEHREQLEGLAQALLKAETLDAPEAYAAAGVPLTEPDRLPLPPEANICTPAVQTARLTSAEATIAVATTGESRCSASPSEATAAGTPSCAQAVNAAPSGWRTQQRREHVDHDVQHRERACQREQRGVIDEPGEVELGAEHDEVERHEEAVGDAAHLR